MVISHIVFIIENEYRSIINYSNNIVITSKQNCLEVGTFIDKYKVKIYLHRNLNTLSYIIYQKIDYTYGKLIILLEKNAWSWKNHTLIAHHPIPTFYLFFCFFIIRCSLAAIHLLFAVRCSLAICRFLFVFLFFYF